MNVAVIAAPGSSRAAIWSWPMT